MDVRTSASTCLLTRFLQEFKEHKIILLIVAGFTRIVIIIKYVAIEGTYSNFRFQIQTGSVI